MHESVYGQRGRNPADWIQNTEIDKEIEQRLGRGKEGGRAGRWQRSRGLVHLKRYLRNISFTRITILHVVAL